MILSSVYVTKQPRDSHLPRSVSIGPEAERNKSKINASEVCPFVVEDDSRYWCGKSERTRSHCFARRGKQDNRWERAFLASGRVAEMLWNSSDLFCFLEPDLDLLSTVGPDSCSCLSGI